MQETQEHRPVPEGDPEMGAQSSSSQRTGARPVRSQRPPQTLCPEDPGSGDTDVDGHMVEPPPAQSFPEEAKRTV